MDWPTVFHRPKRDHRARGGPASIVVVHGTGATDIKSILRYYTHSTSGIGPHWLIDYDGVRHHFVDESEVAYHAGHGSGDADHRDEYKAGLATWTRVLKEGGVATAPDQRYTFWRKRWPGAQGPQDLACGLEPNVRSVGVELQSPKRRQPRGYYDAQYASLADLLREAAQRHGFPLDRAHILGHEDVNPIARCTARGPYDPGLAFDWDGLLAATHSDRSEPPPTH